MLRILDEIATLNPWKEFERMGFDFPRIHSFGRGVRPNFVPVNLYENEEGLKVVLRVPGWQADWFDVSVEGEQLKISGKVEQSEDQAVMTSQFSRVVSLPYPVQADEVKATYKNGLLEIDLLKHEQAKPRKIQVQVA